MNRFDATMVVISSTGLNMFIILLKYMNNFHSYHTDPRNFREPCVRSNGGSVKFRVTSIALGYGMMIPLKVFLTGKEKCQYIGFIHLLCFTCLTTVIDSDSSYP